MIFVTVGTHEQPFNRLIKKVDELKRDGIIKEDVIMQIGFSTYIPQYCKYKKLIPYCEMIENVRNARIVITHGGPSSFIMPLQFGQIPVVVPRQSKYNEHVNDHQLDFVNAVEERYGNIVVVDDIDDLESTIKNYQSIIKKMDVKIINNNSKFCEKFENEVNKLMGE